MSQNINSSKVIASLQDFDLAMLRLNSLIKEVASLLEAKNPNTSCEMIQEVRTTIDEAIERLQRSYTFHTGK